MASIKMQFVKEKETRNTVRYSEVSTSFVGTLYVAKETFNGGKYASRITVTLSFEEER